MPNAGRQSVTFWDTYSPVVSWPVVRFILTHAIINRWKTKQVDFVMAYPQADSEVDNHYMQVPKGVVLSDIPPGASPKDFVFHIKKNIYGQRQAGRV